MEEYSKGILNGDINILSKAITLVESTLISDNELAEKVIEKILPYTGGAVRVGITGVPGVGKSTFLESFGKHITSLGKKIAILAIDPSSQLSKGSILGDKTRMEELARDKNAFIRPTASGNTLGGVHHKTREVMLLCEACRFDYIFIETVGVGQSETAVQGIVDFFLLLMLAGAGDELQGIKKGIMEMADALVITKSDGDNIEKSKLAKRQYRNALHLFPPNENEWVPKVLTCSSIENTGVIEVYDLINKYVKEVKEKGYFYLKRKQQSVSWLCENIDYHLKSNFYLDKNIEEEFPKISKQVEKGDISALLASKKLLKTFYDKY